MVIEGRAPLLQSERFYLVKIHYKGFAVQILVACTVIEARQMGEGEATNCRVLDCVRSARRRGRGTSVGIYNAKVLILIGWTVGFGPFKKHLFLFMDH
jgi:hypothetical protein